MATAKVYYQHLYKELLTEIDEFSASSSLDSAQSIFKRICSLEKPQKKDFLIKRLKTNKNFMMLFAVMYEDLIESQLDNPDQPS